MGGGGRAETAGRRPPRGHGALLHGLFSRDGVPATAKIRDPRGALSGEVLPRSVL